MVPKLRCSYEVMPSAFVVATVATTSVLWTSSPQHTLRTTFILVTSSPQSSWREAGRRR